MPEIQSMEGRWQEITWRRWLGQAMWGKTQKSSFQNEKGKKLGSPPCTKAIIRHLPQEASLSFPLTSFS